MFVAVFLLFFLSRDRFRIAQEYLFLSIDYADDAILFQQMHEPGRSRVSDSEGRLQVRRRGAPRLNDDTFHFIIEIIRFRSLIEGIHSLADTAGGPLDIIT